jgi:hypothetical protein
MGDVNTCHPFLIRFDSLSHNYLSDAISLDELAFWIAFNRVSGIGPVSSKSLLDYFHDDLEEAWRADSQELAQAGLTQKTVENVVTNPRLKKPGACQTPSPGGSWHAP